MNYYTLKGRATDILEREYKLNLSIFSIYIDTYTVLPNTRVQEIFFLASRQS